MNFMLNVSLRVDADLHEVNRTELIIPPFVSHPYISTCIFSGVGPFKDRVRSTALLNSIAINWPGISYISAH